MFKNEQGLSLVEITVAMGILGGLGFGVMKLSENMRSMENRSVSVMDSREVLSEVRAILENEKNCKVSLVNPGGPVLTFKKSEIDEPGKDGGLPIELWFGNADGTARAQKKFSDGTELGKAKISSVRLFMNNGVGNDYLEGVKSDLGIVRVAYFLPGQGQKVTQRDFLINVDFKTDATGTSSIIGCERSTIKSMCDSLNMDYNSEFQRCMNPVDTCDEWFTVAENTSSGWKEGTCNRLDGGYIQSMKLGQIRDGDKDSNSLKIKCCYSKKYHFSKCLPVVELAGTDWWEGNKTAVCDASPRGYFRKIEFYQGTSGSKDTNGMKIQCCYPN